VIAAIGALTAAVADLQALAGAVGAPAVGATPATPAPESSGGSFSHALQQAIGRLDNTITAADAQAKSFASGNHDIPISDVMISLEQANIALQMATTVRDKVVAAYSSVMNMQI
jgi:flagellar hook-basal body complex protein FliE